MPAPEVTIRKGYLDGPWGQIHFRKAGESGEPLILCHQSFTSSAMFEAAFPYLVEAGFMPIAIDMPGCGMSDLAVETSPTIPEYAEVIGLVLDHFGIEQAHMLGHHTGAAMVCAYATIQSTKVKSLILNVPPMATPEEIEAVKDRLPKGPAPIKEDGSHLMDAWTMRTRFTPGWTNLRAMHDRLLERFIAGDSYWKLPFAVAEYDMKPDFMALSLPTLLFSNNGDASHRLAVRAKELRPDLPYIELEGGTHDIIDERPEEWTEVVSHYIGEL